MDFLSNRFLTSTGDIISYDLTTSFGQVIYDNSGSLLHGVLGSTLLAEDVDPILTDRGGYFESSRYICLPPNALLPEDSLTLSNFYSVFFAYLISQGTIFSIFNSASKKLELSYTSNVLSLSYNDGLLYGNLELSVQSNTWIPVMVILNALSLNGCLLENLAIKVALKDTRLILSSLSETTVYNIKIGSSSSGFTGFISEFHMFSASFCQSAYDTHSLTAFPNGDDNPYVINNVEVCDCGDFSCTGSVSNCIRCHDDCDLMCLGSSNLECIDGIGICKPYAIINGVCDTSSSYLSNCRRQESSTICLACDSGYNLSTDQTICCPNGYFGSSGVPCTACDSHCSECTGPNSNECLKCSDSLATLNSGTCTCELGTSINGSCLGCLNECLTCSTSTTCDSCKDSNANLDLLSRCSCLSGFYKDPSGSCQFCNIKCSTCSGGLSSECLTCSDANAESLSGTCTCKSQFYYNDVSLLCEPCSSNCLSCSDDVLCTSCKDPNAEVSVVPGPCSCKLGFFDNGSSPLTCAACDQTCRSCSGPSVNECNDCKDALAFKVNSVCKCSDGFSYNNLFQCSSCHVDCLTCVGLGEENCSLCSDPHASLGSGLNTCQCGSGYFKQGQMPFSCVACHDSCETCTDSGIYACSSCKDQRASVIQGKCECPLRYFLNGLFLCQSCHDTCLTCSGLSGSECLSCSDSTMIFAEGECFCMETLFFDFFTRKCQKCPDICKSCITDSECTQCIDKDLELVQGKCFCKNGFFFENFDLMCKPCHYSCRTCSGRGISDCLSCVDQSVSPYQGFCVCLSGYFMESKDPINCGECNQECLECTGPSSSDCLKCRDENSLLESNVCVCQDGYFKDENSTCISCHHSCLTCHNSTSNDCISCKDQTFLDSQGICKNCLENCDHCTNVTKCLQCTEGFYLNEEETCNPCDESCLSCSNSGPEYCLTCKNQNIQMNSIPGRCSCLPGEFIEKANPLTCHECSEYCESCTETQCLKCFKDFLLVDEKCEKNEFFLDLIVLYNNSILLKFSEKLVKILKDEDIQIHDINENELKFQLSFLAEDEYIVEIIDFKLTSTEKSLYLIFKKNVYSKTGSSLLKLDYSFNIKSNKKSTFDYTEIIKTILVNSIVFSGIASIVFNSNNPYVWLAINTIQILSYSPLLNIEMPSFLRTFLIGLRPLSLIHVDWITSRFFPCNTKSINQQFYDYGFVCKYFFNNTSEIFLSFFAGLLIFLVLLLLKIIPIQKLTEIVEKKMKSYKFAFFLRFWIQGYIEFLIPCVICINFVRFKQLSLSSPSEALNTIFGIFFTVSFSKVLTLITPILLFIFYRSSMRKIKERNNELFQKYSTLLEEFNTNSSIQIFYPISLLVKIIYVFTWYFLYELPIFQVAISAFIPIFNIFLVKNTKIYKEKGTEKMFIFEELTIFFVFALLGMLLINLESKYKQLIGYLIIGIIILSVFVGIFTSIIDFIKKIKNLCKSEKIERSTNANKFDNSMITQKDFKKSSDSLEKSNFIQVVPFNSNYPSAAHSMNY